MKRLALTAMLVLGLLLSTLPTPATAAPRSQAVTPTGTDAGDPGECIDPLKIAHISATVASVLPIPFFSDVADLTEYFLNLALKDCAAVLTPPESVVIDPAVTPDLDADPCTQHLRLPLSDEDEEIITLDRQILEAAIDEIESDPRIDASLTFLRALRDQLESTYGRFESEKQGEYQNIYGIVFSNASHGADWGDFGAPTVYHYNSDVRVQMQHGGTRIDDDYVRFRTGNFSVRWHGETMLSGLDFVYIPGGFDNPGTEKAAREGAKEAVRTSVKKAAREAVERGSREFAEKTVKETVQEFIEETAEEVAEQTLEEAILAILDSYYSLGAPHGVFVDDTQPLHIIDRNAPVITGTAAVTVEALEPGGISASKHINELRAGLTVTDDCDESPELTYNTPRFWPLGETSEIVWTARDNGAAGPTGGVNQAQATQQVTVLDTMPPILVAPPPVVMEGTGVVDVPLGRPQVFDVADLRPTVSNDAPAQFTPGVYNVTWRATDSSGNISDATDDSVQIVNIKTPGTNILPTAGDQTGADAVSAVADEPVKITLRGQDGNTPPDPLWFAIDDQPEHGYFIAPLYPYFIDDYRMTARYSPQIAQQEGEEFAWEVAQSREAMRQYVISLCQEDINRRDLPKDFVSWNGGSSKYIAVDDDGYTYLFDSAYRKCSPGGSTVAPFTTPRISVWDENGLYVGELERGSDSRPLRDINFNLGRGTIIAVSSDGSSTGNSLVEIAKIQPENSTEPIVSVQTYSLWNEINNVFVGEDNTARGPEYKNAGAAAWDTGANVLYVIGDPNQNLKGMAAFRPSECNNTTGRGPEDCLELLGVPVFSTSITQSTKWGDYPGVAADAMQLRRIRDITLDSQGHVYILAEPIDNASGFDRIYKFAPATVNADGSTTLGELIGWLGRCEDGPNCNYIDQHSIGFSCTDATCTVSGDTGGAGPGQLDSASAIEMDPNDVLYVADSGNERVQRFNSDGLFAGEARSTGDGDGFVLGDFGRPGNIAVNSNSFYIIDVDTELVHVFDAAVVHGIDSSSAWVEYQSDSNFVGEDRFTFTATDGFRTADGAQLTSPPATVAINVARNFRPPDAADGLTAFANEDTPVAITLEGNDLDGDGLTFEITQPPVYGTLAGSSPTFTYTPDTNYAGEDQFEFVAVDDSGDADNRSQPEPVRVTIAPVNDTPRVTFDDDSLRGGAGYPVTLLATSFDPDRDDEHTVTVDWGDGTVEPQGQAMNDGTLSGPVLVPSDGANSQIRGIHTYAGQGEYTIEVCVTDLAGATGCAQQQITVIPMVDLSVTRTGPQVVGAGASELAYVLAVTNRAPAGGGGITAADVVLTETLGPGLRFGAVTGSDACAASGATLTCTIGTLTPDTAVAVKVTIEFVGAPDPGATFDNTVTATQRDEDPIPENNELRYTVTVVRAADFVVDSYDDLTDATPGDGLCATRAATCTLRAAVQEANALAGKQSIALATGVYLLNPPVLGPAPTVEPSPEDAAVQGDLDLTDDVAIYGLSAQDTIIHGNNEDRLLHIIGAVEVTLEDVLLTSGAPLDPFRMSALGGGVYNDGGTVTLRRVTVVGNASTDGAGIYNAAGSMLVDQSTIMGNTAAGNGGGMDNHGELTLRNSTVNGNRAETGGGISGSDGVARVENVTLTDNVATSGGGAINGPGETVVAVNTIIAGNSAPVGPACSAAFRSEGFNLIDKLDDCSILGTTGSNIVGEPAGLEAAAVNAADTYSQLPEPDSRAVDAGECRLAVDQRGQARPAGDGCDIGAVEVAAADVDTPPMRLVHLPVVFR